MPTFLAVLILSLVHLFALKPHGRLLSIGGGVSVAYVFIDLLPKLGKVQPLVLFTFAMALHYFINDFTLSKTHKHGRYVLIACLFLGWLVGQWIVLPPTAVALVSAFIGGGVIMNVIRHELPAENPHSLPAFLIAALAYTALLLRVGNFS